MRMVASLDMLRCLVVTDRRGGDRAEGGGESELPTGGSLERY